MKRTFLFTITTGCMMLFGAVAYGQVPPAQAAQTNQEAPKHEKLTDEQKVEHEIAKLDGAVHLTAEQNKQVKELFTKLMNQRKANKQTAGGDVDKMKAMNKELAEQRKEGLKSILTKEQMAMLKEANKERKSEKMQEHSK